MEGAGSVAENLVLGLDAGSTHVAAALAEAPEGGEPRVIGVGLVPSAGVYRGLISDLSAAARAMRKAAEAACAMAGRPQVNRAVISISGAHLRSEVGAAAVAVPRPAAGVTPELVRRVLDAAAEAVEPSAGRERVHVIPRSYQLDGSVPLRDPTGLCGRTLAAEVQVVTGDALHVQNHLRAASQAGFEVADYLVAVRAAGEAVLTPEEREEGVLLLDIGGGTTGVAVYELGHLFHLAVLPVGGDHITHDLATVLRIPVETAERLKRERGWAAPRLAGDGTVTLPTPSGLNTYEVSEKYVAEIIGSRVEEILQMAAAAVKRSGYAGLFPAGLVLTGGGSRLRGLAGYAGDCLSLKSRIGTPADSLAAEPELAAAAGLALWGVRAAPAAAEGGEPSEPATDAAEARPARAGRLRDWLKALFH
ncbi:cell division protein FtsA [Symbiobacterium thermophilum IAM 14863]|uniref:Cell division protein FtsA n=1 Tax=Symbiobacterium thermophilum (strain DSM 24528 / JCM 14929 / IAM 14863 / T) TaxID=292459 RepID=Q67Q40_SYMTH|nr:cell division protein FtsA [Symbiobacterium thermophilum IAM 14863]